MLISATAKSVRVSPKKAREVAALLRGQSVNDALTILEHTPRRAASYIAKVVASAKANATNNHSMTEDTLVVNSVQVNLAGAYKRWRPAARGRALTYKHRLSHITVELDGQSKVKSTKKPTKDNSPPKTDKKEAK